ncbi:uncharacterized protein LOC121750345 isoform X2 [Salvia splendens]|uniref:uncharacterized protein LOC121750345 isoform X2 n=1 Tax=Salvia splendens TaxID=180675 RepID=UPI001C266F93|nr:uncharacterized protein LOC121750345 isoform X2 [Salvia splendens]
MSMSIPLQAKFFFKGLWSPSVDDVILSTAIRMKSVRGWNGKQVPAEVFFEASHAVLTKLGCKLTPDDIKERMQFFELRYRTFKAVVATYGVTWDVKDHIIQADEAVWKKIFKPFAAAYFHCDELDFSRLAIVFGMEDVKVEDSPNVIVISDSTEILSPRFVHTITTPTDPGEVNSPLITVSGSVRRKLFDEEGDSRDRESNNGHLPPYYSPPNGVKLDSSLGKPKLDDIVKQLTPPDCSPNVYSSASWSPFGGYRKH